MSNPRTVAALAQLLRAEADHMWRQAEAIRTALGSTAGGQLRHDGLRQVRRCELVARDLIMLARDMDRHADQLAVT